MTIIKSNASKGKKTKRQEENIYDIIFTFSQGIPVTLYSISEAATEDIMADMKDKNIDNISYSFSDGFEICIMKCQINMVRTTVTATII